MCARTSLSQDGFHRRGLWVVGITYYGVAPPPFLTSKELPSREGLLDFKNEKYVVSYLLSGQGAASSLNCPAILVLENQSTGNESPIAYPGWGGTHLPPTSMSRQNIENATYLLFPAYQIRVERGQLKRELFHF